MGPADALSAAEDSCVCVLPFKMMPVYTAPNTLPDPCVGQGSEASVCFCWWRGWSIAGYDTGNN